MIRKRAVYETDGKQFGCEEDLIQHMTNMLGELMETIPEFNELHPGKKIKMVQAILVRPDYQPLDIAKGFTTVDTFAHLDNFAGKWWHIDKSLDGSTGEHYISQIKGDTPFDDGFVFNFDDRGDVISGGYLSPDGELN